MFTACKEGSKNMEGKTVYPREPEMKGVFRVPSWWHHHGDKMILTQVAEDKKSFVLEGSAARLEVAYTELGDDCKGFLVSWEVRQSRSEKVNGTVFFTPETLRAAFGLVDQHSMGQYCPWLIKEYGGTVAYQRYFIRWNQYLNIPHPGTGHDGDPNISIELHQKILDAVTLLLNKCFPQTDPSEIKDTPETKD